MQQTLQTFYQNLDQCYTNGDADQIERFLLEAEAQYRENTAGAAEIGIAVYNELGSLYRGISRYDASISSFQHARELVEQEIGADSVQYATVLNNMAGTCRLMGHFDDALKLFHMAEEIYAHAGEEQSYAYASVLNNMSLVYRELEDLQPAIDYLEKALTIIRTMPNTEQEIAITYNNLAAMYRLANDTEKAKQCVDLAIEFLKSAERKKMCIMPPVSTAWLDFYMRSMTMNGHLNCTKNPHSTPNASLGRISSTELPAAICTGYMNDWENAKKRYKHWKKRGKFSLGCSGKPMIAPAPLPMTCAA